VCAFSSEPLRAAKGPRFRTPPDDLIRHLLALVFAFRSSGFRASSEVWPDLETLNFLYELGEIAAAGGDIRHRVLG
jgi:hypothetical protein